METTPQSPYLQEAKELSLELLKLLSGKSTTVQTKYDYYNADIDIRDFGISTPRSMINSRPGIGWASRAVNTLSDRVIFDGFAKDTFSINSYMQSINGYSVIAQSKHDSFIAGCSFVLVSDHKDGRKIIVPFTALEATGVVDQTSGLLKYGLVVTKWSMTSTDAATTTKKGYSPADYMVLTPNFTAIFISRTISEIRINPTGRTLLHAITHRSSAERPLGKSRLTNTARRIIQEVGRLKRREEIAEEFYALPQRYINGLAEGAKKDASLDSAIGKIWAITKDDEGDKPEIGQLPQMSISQFSDAKKDKARDFCAETALSLRNLGYESGNPSSAESLAAMSDDLSLEATKSQIEMGDQIKNIIVTLQLAINKNSEIPVLLNELVPAWKPIFQVDVGEAGDAMFKLFEIMPELQGTIASYRMLGIGIREAEELAAKRIANGNAAFMNNRGTV